MLEEVDRVISSYTVASARDFVKTTTSGDILAYRKISGKCQKVKVSKNAIFNVAGSSHLHQLLNCRSVSFPRMRNFKARRTLR